MFGFLKLKPQKKKKARKNKADLLVLKVKRAAFFMMGLLFFLFPGQNFFLTLSNFYRPTGIRALNFELSSPAALPVNLNLEEPPNLTAHSVLVLDKNSAVILWSKNERIWLLPASTVKIMTALVALDHYQLSDILTVGKVSLQGQDMELVAGEQISAQNLLYGLLLASANDAALILAQNYPGGEKAFIKAMNDKAAELNLTDSYFVNPTGLDSDEEGHLLAHYSYTTALDLARLSVWALQNPFFTQTITQEKIEVTDITGKTKHALYNVNQLLGKIEGLKGIKTGWTEEAGECLVAYVQKNGQEIVTVVLGSQDRFGETSRLINWVFRNFSWQKVIPSIADQEPPHRR
jgi:D-alanyl-D-alanine carboxypeptidase